MYGPVIGLIYSWRAGEHLGKPAIRARLAAYSVLYPPPGPAGWSLALVDEILSTLRYSGAPGDGPPPRKGGKKVWTPASEWIWSAEPTHDALVDKATWDAAQRIGRRHLPGMRPRPRNAHHPARPPVRSSVPAGTAPSATGA